MADQTLFDKIVSGEIPSYKIWEDANYLAFLTPFANTPGATVVIPKQNPGEYAFGLSDEQLSGLMAATKKVANLLEKAFNVPKVAMVFEGEAVPHVHAKLYPMHGYEQDRSQFPQFKPFFSSYPGFILSADGPQMSSEQLQQIQQKIQEAADEN